MNGANSRMVSVITGKTAHEEETADTHSFDLVRAVRARWMTWFGHILRMDPQLMLYRTVQHMYGNLQGGNILMDASKADTWRELTNWVSDTVL